MLQEETLEFFRELRENNTREWFEHNRKRFEGVKKDYHSVVAKVLGKMKSFDPQLYHLEVKDCVFRIYRDIRFSKDKTPYKTHMGIVMSPKGRRLENAGYYVHLDEGAGSFAGGGIWLPSADVLKKLRREISAFYEDLQEIMDKPDFKKYYSGFDREEGAVLSRPPKGYNPDDPAIEFLKFKSFTVSKEFHAGLLSDPDGVEKVVEFLKPVKSLNDFFNRALSE